MSDPLAEQFRRLAAQWKAGRGPHSSARRLCDHPAHAAVVAMGAAAVPLILEELRVRPEHWFVALHRLTGASPVRPESQGDLARMAADWVAWGVAAGLVPPAGLENPPGSG